MRKKRILLLSEGFGSGHTQAAHALAASLRMLSSSVVTRVLELGAFQHPTLAPLIYAAYRKTVETKPKLYGKLYKNQQQKSLNRLLSLALHRLFYARTSRIIDHLRPDLVVCTHPFPSIVVSRLKRSGYRIPLCAVFTDYDGHGTWISSEVDRYFVPTSDVMQRLTAKGVPAEQIEVTGIPIHPKFLRQHDKRQIREQFSLREMPTVLMMGGGWGMIDNDDLVQVAGKWREQVQFLFCLGVNEKLRQRLSEDERLNHPNVRLFGYTKEIDKLMDVSHLLITKPGGMTCTEAMAKGIPMMFYNPIPGQEEENSQYFLENGFAERIDSPELLSARLAELVSDPARAAAELRERRPRQKTDPLSCPKRILEMLQESSVDKAHRSLVGE